MYTVVQKPPGTVSGDPRQASNLGGGQSGGSVRIGAAKVLRQPAAAEWGMRTALIDGKEHETHLYRIAAKCGLISTLTIETIDYPWLPETGRKREEREKRGKKKNISLHKLDAV